MVLKWRSESRLHSTSSSRTAAWPHLKSNFAHSSAKLYLSLPQDYKHQVQLMQGSEHQSVPKVWNTGGTVGKHKRCRVSLMTDLVRKSAEAGYPPSFHCVHAIPSVLKLILCFANVSRWNSIAKPVSAWAHYSQGKESVQNREFGLNKSLIKNVVYLELQKHTGHISLILHLSECKQ